MKLALISPKSSFLGRSPEFRELFTSWPEMEFYRRYWSGVGLGLLVVAALTPEHIEIDLIDENVELVDFDRQYNLVGLTAMTQQATRAYEISGAFRARGRKVVLGGIHATVMPDEARLHADAVVAGEAEELWPKVVRDFEAGELRSLYVAERSADLAKTPVPRYALLADKPCQVIWIQTSRGCPHDCSFCSASKVYGTAYRYVPIAQVIESVRKIRTLHPRAMLGFSDDNLFGNRRRSQELLEQLKHCNARWIGQSDISIARYPELLELIRASGCVALFVGFESLETANLMGLDRHNWKLAQREHYERSIEVVQSHGIGIFGTFVVGFDHDHVSTFDQVAAFVRDNQLVGAQIAALTPFPRTRIREQLLAEGRVLDTPWQNYTLYDANIRPRNMSPEQLQQGVLETFKSVYSKQAAAAKARHFREIFSRLQERRETR
jgi:radical SAM superfamily enzyme YgiQ (UPF0313 family)